METQFARGGMRDPRAGEMSFREWHDRWWNARIVEPHTLRGDASSIKNHVMPYWADWEMRAIPRMDVQSWIRSLVEKGAGPAAIKRAYNLTSSIMRAAVDDDVIAVSPCRSIDLPPIAVKPPQWFTPDQAQSILDGLAPAWRTMCLLGFYTGLRWGELSGLHRHRIDTRRSRLFVVEVNTKSGIKEYPKSSKSRREVPLPPHVGEERRPVKLGDPSCQGRILRHLGFGRAVRTGGHEFARPHLIQLIDRLLGLHPPTVRQIADCVGSAAPLMISCGDRESRSRRIGRPVRGIDSCGSLARSFAPSGPGVRSRAP
ncbi:tyrosine-type recombinase/integrase [Streptomyces sp. MMS24-I29]|uniref:tyrosine-type recombinase/integrase n=1 Tax=Streptomyces sp. MMS24-I29 TaxID=3351480 RepID=UPI003C7A673C